MALPYVAVLTVMTLLVIPHLKKDYNIEGEQRRLIVSAEAVMVIFAYVIYIIFAVSKSFMPGTGSNDAYAYYLNFTRADCTLKHFMTEVTTFEPGYSFVVWIVRQVTVDYRFMLWFWHTLTFVFTACFYKKVYLKNNYSLVIFMGLTILITQFNTLRMSISISIALYSLISMYEKRWIKALIIIICAASMQISAVIMLPVLIVVFIAYNRNNYKKTIVMILIILGSIMTVVMFGLINRITLGTDKSVYVGHSSVAWGTDFAVIVFLVLSYAKFGPLKKIAGINEVFMMALPIELICIPLQLNMAIMYRMILYFIPIIYSLIPSIIQCYKDAGNNINYFIVKIISYGYLISRIYAFIIEEVVYLHKYVT